MTALAKRSLGIAALANPELAVEDARQLLARAVAVDEVKAVHDQAEALALYARKRRAGIEAQAAATEIVIWSRRRIGELTRAMPRGHGPGRGKTSPKLGKFSQLAELGLTSAEVSRCEALASVDEARIVAHVRGVRARAERLTVSGMIAALSHGEDYDSDEWHTPRIFVPRFRRLLGGRIDVDGASNAIAQRVIRARTFYTKELDGLVHPWHGTVFLNPPFSRALIGRFVGRFIAMHAGRTPCGPKCARGCPGRLTRGIVVVNASTDTAWWHALAERFPVCVTRGRFAFERADGAPVDNNNSGQTIFGAGMTALEMRRELESKPEIGIVLERAIPKPLSPRARRASRGER